MPVIAQTSELAVGVDVGGTNIKMVLVARNGRVLARAEGATPRGSDAEGVVDGFVGLVREFRSGLGALSEQVGGYGLCFPQPIDGPDAVQRQTNNMPSLEGFPMRPALVARLGPSVRVSYDVWAANVAERLFGAGTSAQRLVTVSIGTGIGMGVFTEEGPVDFNWGGTGDAGQIIVDPNATERCSCGALGCLESLACAGAIRRDALRLIEMGRESVLSERLTKTGDIGARDVFAAAADGDAVGLEVVNRVARYVGVALTSYIHMFRPELIVICGGVAQAGEVLLSPVRATVASMASPWYFARLRGIEASAFPVDGAAIGAAATVLYPQLARPRQQRNWSQLVRSVP